jgi:serpin B
VETFLKLSIFVLLFPGMMIFNNLYSENFNSFIKGNNQFAIDLYKQMSRSNENIFFSPISISNAFAMLYAGTDGKTKKEIKQVFHFTPEKELHPYFSELIRRLKNVSGCELNIANALWVQEGYEFKKEFLNIVKKFYDGVVKELNFKTSPEECRKKINEWVEQKTKGKIKELIEKGSISSLTRLISTNAIYFNGEWCHQFNKKLTKEMPFYQINGIEKQVPMMQFEDFKEFNYFEDTIVQVLEMKYKGEKISMIIILPKNKDGIKNVEEVLNIDILNNWLDRMRLTKVDVYFPKFKMERAYTLTENLRGLGIISLFGPEANLSGITGERDLFISEIFHKSYIDVNETGTEATAATGVGFPESIPMKEEPKIFKADHPFIFLIYDKDTSAILFIGRVLEP